MQTDIVQPTAVSQTEASSDMYTRTNLTRMQMLYWTGHQLRPDIPLYAAPIMFAIPGAFNTALFCNALQAVFEQSDALRTVIQNVDGVPQQIVRPKVEVPLQIQDFTTTPDPRTAARQWFQELACQPFDLQKSLVQFALAKVENDQHLWLMNQHHIIADAASSFFIYQVVARTYENLLDPIENSQPPAITPYQIYREYEQEFRESALCQRADKYWKQRLQEDAVPLHFFGQRTRKKGTHTIRKTVELEPAVTEKLAELAAVEEFRDLTEELTLFNILAALYFALVYHLTGNKHLTFLTPMHNRPTQAFRQTIGLLMELCPFVVDIDPGETPTSLIQKLKKQTRGVMRFAQYGSSIPLNSKAHDIMFNYHRRPLLTYNGQRVRQEHLHVGQGTESFSIHVHEFEGSGTFKVKFDFHQDIFTEQQQQTTIAMFNALLESFLTDREAQLTKVELPYSALQTATSQPEATQSNTTAYVPPRDRLELDLKNIWEATLGAPRIGIYDNYFDLGGTSWQAMNLFAEIEKLTGQYLPLATLVEAGTIAALAEKLRQQTGAEAWPTLVTIQEGAADQKPLYLVHGGGGHVLIFTKLARYLPDTQPVFAFQAQGLDGKTQPLGSTEEMAARYVEALLTHQPEGPYQLGGYSMGGAVAFEMAQQLVARGHKISFVGIIDTPAQHPALKWVRLCTKLAARLLRFSPQKEQQLFVQNRHRFWVGIRQVLRNQKYRLTKQVNKQNPQARAGTKQKEDARVQKITHINNRAFFCYVPKRYPGPVTLFKSTEGYQDMYRDTKDPLMGWQRVSTSVNVCILPGNHNQIMDEPFVQNLADAFVLELKK
ncbi:alpha/beta fold hydrolase [Candidatus Leptofilum sp.]|uniref:alpha/beta fold hydrolase n=1 Tax=Candidatus Leptofilum sp. TaxID=3241576 RepID=UPI003B59DBD7